MLHLTFDNLTRAGHGRPNLAVWQAEPYTEQWRQYDLHWPYTVPLRLELFLKEFGLPFHCHRISDAPAGSWYPIGISWWNFDMDYVDLVSQPAKQLLRQKKIKLLFYYHEGDNPARIRHKITSDLITHGIAPDAAVLISANSAAKDIPGCIYFDDFECWFSVLNKGQSAPAGTLEPKPFNFTVLSRTHKWWRATILHDLDQDGILDHSLWSYGDLPCGDDWQDNPIRCSDREKEIRAFVNRGPRSADHLDPSRHNDHHWINTDLYQQSHFHLVLETHFDADQSNGSFLTEKTYKCIKYGQPFLIAGAQGSLQVLRNHGYDVFDTVLDNAYDQEPDNTRRWQKLRTAIRKIHFCAGKLSEACQIGVSHNQALFRQRPITALNTLLEKLI